MAGGAWVPEEVGRKRRRLLRLLVAGGDDGRGEEEGDRGEPQGQTRASVSPATYNSTTGIITLNVYFKCQRS